MRIHAISDLHTDFAANLLIIEGLSKSAYRDDVLLVAGDIGDPGDRQSYAGGVEGTIREGFLCTGEP
jgi:predicted phosphodiesterase